MPQTTTRKLVGYDKFVRHNPRTDKFEMQKFHHVEFWCADATNTYNRFSWGLGMHLVAKSDQSTGNQLFCSYVLQSNDLLFSFTAPYSVQVDKSTSKPPYPNYDQEFAYGFLKKHGLAVRALGILVKDAAEAYKNSVENGAVGVLEPSTLIDEASQGKVVISEIKLYGDVVLRFVSNEGFNGPYLPNFAKVETPDFNFGLLRLDHAVGNVPVMFDVIDYIQKATGLHEFAEFTAADVGTVDSGLNSMVLANNNEMILLPINEPTFGTKRKSQIQTYIEQNEGPGLQHLALKTNDIFRTMREMRQRTLVGGFDFMPRPSDNYYKNLPEKIGDILTKEQYEEVEKLGLLADKDDQGTLLQIFTKPLGDRPTVFIEIIQRIGCMEKGADGVEEQKGGCGGFGKGNFSELFKSIEDYEKTLRV